VNPGKHNQTLTKPIEHYKQREKLTESIIAFTDTDPLQEVI